MNFHRKVTLRIGDQHQKAGFTLIELLAVMVIIGLIVGTAVLRFSGLTGPARLEWAVGRLATFENALRNHAADHSETAALKIELGTDRVTRIFEDDRKAASTILLGSNVQFRRFVSETKDAASGQVTIDYSPQGQSETFAVELRGAAGNSVWLVFAGVTGQVTRFNEEHDALQLVRVVRSPGTDAS